MLTMCYRTLLESHLPAHQLNVINDNRFYVLQTLRSEVEKNEFVKPPLGPVFLLYFKFKRCLGSQLLAGVLYVGAGSARFTDALTSVFTANDLTWYTIKLTS